MPLSLFMRTLIPVALPSLVDFAWSRFFQLLNLPSLNWDTGHRDFPKLDYMFHPQASKPRRRLKSQSFGAVCWVAFLFQLF